MTTRSSSSNGPLWLIAGIASIVAVGVVAWLVMMTVTMFAWGGWDWNWGHMGRMHGGGSDTSGSAVVAGGTSETVDIRDYAFSPGNLQVPVGAAVTWVNYDGAPHNAAERGGDWKTKNLDEGESDTVTFDVAGEYAYYCTIHPSMKAKLVVR
ncbi:MAG TPA: cupredoxin family copper-binding protein [Dehalococcoidia bacterium]|nr:cupredoxin family copper-binding protein [Dehalococcoidia bacterium]